mgnify:CR=1 FL=1
MEYEQKQISLSLSPIDFIESTDFIDELGIDTDCIDNSNDDTLVFGLDW